MGKKNITKVDAIENMLGSNKPGIYKITFIPTGMSYVGQTLKSIKERLYQHMNNIAIGNDEDIEVEESKHIDAIFNMADVNDKQVFVESDFEYEVLDNYLEPFNPNDPADKSKIKTYLNAKEAFFIEKFNTLNSGYNQTVGNHKELLDEALAANYNHNHTMSEELVDVILDLF